MLFMTNAINTTPSHRPKCPNHGVALEGIGFPMPRKGVGICPVSKCPFDFEVDVQDATTETVKGKDGEMAPKPADWKITGND